MSWPLRSFLSGNPLVAIILNNCRRPCHCPPPRRRPPHRRNHHEADVLDVLAKTPGLYQVPKLRNATTTTTATTTTILELGGKINKENKIQSVHYYYYYY